MMTRARRRRLDLLPEKSASSEEASVQDHQSAAAGGGGGSQSSQEFLRDGVTGCIEVSEMDAAGRTLVPVSSLGGEYAVFVGLTHCMLVSSNIFPSIAADAIYLGYRSQFYHKLSVYHLKTRRTEPPHDFALDEEKRLVPCARPPCNLDQYLVAYVDRKHRDVSCELRYSYAQKRLLWGADVCCTVAGLMGYIIPFSFFLLLSKAPPVFPFSLVLQCAIGLG